ncbi:MAG TPA: lysylphosphatidylglycerol synthase transmembrane domain-containing protein [Candidatus Saccharimonadales bacterium]|nr:lysylphosphatidylglycerol synthase transmembrane domain-containing protein [Candidatus Saccharimonadales bacterium]
MSDAAKAKPMWRRLIGPVLLLAILFFLLLYLKSIDWHKIAQLSVNWYWLVLASVLAMAGRYWAVNVWRVILSCLGVEKLPPYGAMAQVFAKAWMARYIPGTVAWVAGRIYLASQYGISVSRLTVSSLLEGGMQIVAGIVLSLILIALGGNVSDISMPVKVFAVVVALLSMLALLPPIFNRILHVAHLAVKRRKASDELRVNGKAVSRSFLLFCIGTLIAGTANYFVAKSIMPHLGGDHYLYMVGVFGLAGAIGIATPFLPSGIGVRDGIQLVLLALIMPKETALAVTVLSRLWSVVVDVLFFLVAVGFHHRQRQVDKAA